MKLELRHVPTDQSIIGAIHQDEGIIVQTIKGDVYAFVPNGIRPKKDHYFGKYCLMQDGNFTEKRGPASLFKEDADTDEPIAYLVILV